MSFCHFFSYFIKKFFFQKIQILQTEAFEQLCILTHLEFYWTSCFVHFFNIECSIVTVCLYLRIKQTINPEVLKLHQNTQIKVKHVSSGEMQDAGIEWTLSMVTPLNAVLGLISAATRLLQRSLTVDTDEHLSECPCVDSGSSSVNAQWYLWLSPRLVHVVYPPERLKSPAPHKPHREIYNTASIGSWEMNLSSTKLKDRE